DKGNTFGIFPGPLDSDGKPEYVAAGGAHIRCFPDWDFPNIERPQGPTGIMDAAELADALRAVLPAVSTDTARLILTGFCVETQSNLEGASTFQATLCGTDSYRLTAAEITYSGSALKVIVPGR